MGRMWDVAGAHTRGHNHNSLGFCFVGNYDVEEPPEGMLLVGAKVIGFWMRLYNIGIDDIYGHREFAPYKTCPGRMFDIEKLKGFI